MSRLEVVRTWRSDEVSTRAAGAGGQFAKGGGRVPGKGGASPAGVVAPPFASGNGDAKTHKTALGEVSVAKPGTGYAVTIQVKTPNGGAKVNLTSQQALDINAHRPVAGSAIKRFPTANKDTALAVGHDGTNVWARVDGPSRPSFPVKMSESEWKAFGTTLAATNTESYFN